MNGKRLKGKQALKRQRQFLFERQGGRCYWCGCEMVVPVHVRHRPPPPNQATIDHLDSRLSPERGQHGGEPRHVASCWECNGKRNSQEQAALPRAVLWERAKAFPRALRPAPDDHE